MIAAARSAHGMNSDMNIDWHKTKITCDIDLTAQGRAIGDLRLPFSDNRAPLGYYPIPIISLANGRGPTLLLCGGTHGDEYEGPAVIMDLVHALDLTRLRGRIIALPISNAPAFAASARCSPLDGGNLNRAYPGDPEGPPTAMIAHFIESLLLPHCDAAIDFHAGGKASVYAVLAMIQHAPPELYARNLHLARAFSPDFIWLLERPPVGGSVNDAACRQRVPMLASELFGGGRVSRASFQRTRQGLYGVMAALDLLPADRRAAPPETAIPLLQEADNGAVYAKRDGVFVPHIELGERVERGGALGAVYSVLEPERAPQIITCPADGILVSLVHRGRVERGERLALFGDVVGP